jgi:hypothetical protein
MIVNTPIAVGELIDKLSILQIKLVKIKDEVKLRNIRHEHSVLENCLGQLAIDSGLRTTLQDLTGKLRQVNETLWWVEDTIRGKECQQLFDKEFIELARMVYQTNDERSRLKRAINDLLGSAIVEEKSYSPYK